MAAKRSSFVLCSAVLSGAVASWWVSTAAAASEACFERLDNGVDMTGWRKSTTNQHGPGDGWTVEDGAFVGRQTTGQQGGILMTEQSYADAEVLLEVRIDWGCDSGLFLRTTDGNRAYQVTIDHLPSSAVGAIWGEAFPQELRAIPYWLTESGNAAVIATDQSEQPIFDLAEWPSLWDPTAWNEIRARIEGNPPHVQVWISGTKVMDFTDAMLRSDVAESGPLAIQVHSGSRWIEDGTVEFKNIRVRDLSVPCEDPGSGGAGAGAGGGGGSTGGSDASGGQGLAGSGGAGTSGGGAGGESGSAVMPAGSSGAGGAGTGNGGGGQPSGGQPSSGGTGALAGGAPAGGTSGSGASTSGSGGEVTGNGGGASGATPASESGGCGCRVAPRGRGAATLLPMLVLLGWGLVRARRQGRRTPPRLRTIAL
jgi:hypothetical protein